MTYQDYCNIAALAWHIVKGANDPEFTKCAQDHQSKFAYKVQEVHKSGLKSDPFEHHAAAMLGMAQSEWINYVRSCEDSKRLLAELEAKTAQAAIDAAAMAPPDAPATHRDHELNVIHPAHTDEVMLAERGTHDAEELPTQPTTKRKKTKE